MSYIKLQVRRDTAANWTSANPTLSAGEIGFETSTGKFKIGDGSTAWSSLSYFQTGGGGGGGGGDLVSTNNLSDLTNAATARTNLGLSANGSSLVTAANYAAMKALLDLEIGTDVQAYDADLTTWAGLTPSANAQSLVTAANYAAMRTLLGLVIGTDVQSYDADTVKSDTTANLTAGFSATQYSLGTITSGTVTPAFANGNEQKYTNNGAHTLAPATLTAGRATSITVEITNGASAGAITTSGFTKVTGDAFNTTNGHEFKCFIHIGDAGSLLNVVALQ
jgi:hypothetical protein